MTSEMSTTYDNYDAMNELTTDVTGVYDTDYVGSDSGVSMQSLLLSCLRVVLGLLSLVLNMFTVVAFSRVEQLRTCGNMLVVSLAVTDVMVGLIMPFDVLNWAPGISEQFSRSKAWCLLRIAWFNMACIASILNMTEIAVERYLYIVKPFVYARIVNTKSIIIIILTTWTIALIWGSVPLYVNRFSEIQICDPIEAISVEYMVYGGCTVGFTSFIATGILYTLVFRLALQKLRQVVPAAPAGERNQHSVFRMQIQASKQSVAVSLVFIMCWSPYFVANAAHVVTPIPFRIRGLTFSVAIFNSSLNFFVYVVFNPFFRKAIKRWATRFWRCVSLQTRESTVGDSTSGAWTTADRSRTVRSTEGTVHGQEGRVLY